MELGTFHEVDGRPAVRFQRVYRHSPERIWAAITDPAELAHWFPSAVALEPRAGGTIEFSGDPHIDDETGKIVEFDPPRRLVYTWGEHELRFELEPAGVGGCVLTFVDVLPSRDAAALTAAGWNVCLAEMDKLVSGAVANGPHSATAEPWQAHYDAYIAAGMPAGAPIPQLKDKG
nr:FIG01126632: hypothetical protein [Kibdelosporangium sp. MJ126-NF4]